MMSDTRGDVLSHCTQDSSTTYGRQKIANIDEEAYDQGYDYYVNMDPFYDADEDE